MGRESKPGVYRLQQPGPEHIGAVRALATACNAFDNLDLSLDWRQLRARPPGETSDFLFQLDGRWVGYLGLFQFSDQEVEIIGMVLPEYRRRGIFSELWRAAQNECAARGVKRALFICERRSESGRAFLRAIGARWDHAEYKMQLAQPWPAPQNPQRVRLRLATPEDRAEIARQNVIYFGNPGEQEDSIPESLRDDRHAVYIAELAGDPIGKVDLVMNDGDAWIYGLGVLPERRGRGYGREIVLGALDKLRAWNPCRVFLEVNAANHVALRLYRSCGFREKTTYDYYRLRCAGKALQ